MPFSLLVFTGAVAGVSLLVLPWWCAVGEDDDTYTDDVNDSYDSEDWYTDYSDDEEGGGNEEGLTPDELRRLPWFAYCGGCGAGGGRCCSICLEEISDGERFRRPGRCCHAFHAACVDEWLTTRRTCPCCRELVLVPPASPT